MRVNAPPISELRLNRLHRWMLLWLSWFAAFLKQARAFAPFSNQADAIAHQWLDIIEQLLTNIVIIRAALRVRTIAPPTYSLRRKTGAQLRRAVLGSALRRSLRARDLNQRIAALSQDIDALVTRPLKRLSRGLTRLRPHHTRPEPGMLACVSAHAEAALFPNTS